jgi:hypothetical protein
MMKSKIKETLKKRKTTPSAMTDPTLIMKHANYSLRRMDLIMTGSTGTFWWRPEKPVSTFAILSTISKPSVTLPNTQ